ncbi:hypothetical protein QSH18_00875 [Xanthomonas sp. NCPPB 2654]|uniref:hypothetical protein n=1 Tax=unclassified Xanthomonas TaxID=2643310 RepID=UPI0021E0D6C5|nr:MULTISPECIES: hypothetical protein [unclassified Xanthomonas]MDL5364153.1 hypothetical protein [Xanthomonas sp. NCPPB 2654]UYC20857.1 hypothetical protein NUG20_00645 [Xanthomonas sp. CFBP 8443]
MVRLSFECPSRLYAAGMVAAIVAIVSAQRSPVAAAYGSSVPSPCGQREHAAPRHAPK